MLIAGVGAVAWFNVSNAGVSASTDPTGSVQASADTATLGSFAVAGRITAGSEITTAKLTDTNGDTWVGASGAKSMKTSGKAASKWVAVTVVLDITYTQGATTLDAEQIAQAWKASINTKSSLTLTAKDTTTYDGTNFSETDYDNTDGLQSAAHYGLKFSLSNADDSATYDNDADLQFASFLPGNIETQTFTVDNADPHAGHCNGVPGGTVYVGIWGVDGVEQHASDVYGLTIDVAIS